MYNDIWIYNRLPITKQVHKSSRDLKIHNYSLNAYTGLLNGHWSFTGQ